jgi:peptidoglycan/LPS O-acetylase OafA/YrhL
MRAVAVGLVVLFHAGLPWVSGGFVGVDVFFVISGYLITSHLVGELRSAGRVSLVAFYARRAKRLLPLAAVVTVATVIGTWVLTSGLQTREVAEDAVWASLFAMNVHLAAEGVDYGAAGEASPFQHFWSLAIEEQFYLVWPLVLAGASLVWWRGRRVVRVDLPVEAGSGGGAGGGTGRGGGVVRSVSVVGMSLVVGAVALASFGYGVHQTAVAQSLAYYVTPARAWELAVGALVAVNAGWLARQGWLQRGWLAWAGLGVVVVAAVVFDESTSFPGYWALLPVLGTAAVVVAGLSRATSLERSVLSALPLQGIGRISYGLYLWHWPMLVLAPAYFDTETLSTWQITVLVVLSAWLATTTYFAVEDPVRALPVFRRRPRHALAAGAATLTLTLTTAAAALTLAPDPRGSGVTGAGVDVDADVAGALRVGLATVDVPADLDPALTDALGDDPSRQLPASGDCHVNLLATTLSSSEGAQCVFGDPDGDTTVLLTGDSHAYQWLPALDQVARNYGWRVISHTKGACPLYDVRLENRTLQRDYRECYRWREGVRDLISAERPDLVVTTAAIFNSRGDEFTEDWVAGVHASVSGLVRAGRDVVVLEDTPYPRFDVPKCLAQNLDNAQACTVPIVDALSDPVRRERTRAAALEAGAVVVDPTPWLCIDGACPPLAGNILVYRDNSHLTATYSARLGASLGSVLAPLLGEEPVVERSAPAVMVPAPSASVPPSTRTESQPSLLAPSPRGRSAEGPRRAPAQAPPPVPASAPIASGGPRPTSGPEPPAPTATQPPSPTSSPVTEPPTSTSPTSSTGSSTTATPSTDQPTSTTPEPTGAPSAPATDEAPSGSVVAGVGS